MVLNGCSISAGQSSRRASNFTTEIACKGLESFSGIFLLGEEQVAIVMVSDGLVEILAWSLHVDSFVAIDHR